MRLPDSPCYRTLERLQRHDVENHANAPRRAELRQMQIVRPESASKHAQRVGASFHLSMKVLASSAQIKGKRRNNVFFINDAGNLDSFEILILNRYQIIRKKRFI